MRNATIATSRTRASSDDLIAYRPLPAAWGDVEALHDVRAARARAAEHGLDPSTVTPAPSAETADATGAVSSRPGLMGLLRGGPGTRRRDRRGAAPHHHGSRLATV